MAHQMFVTFTSQTVGTMQRVGKQDGHLSIHQTILELLCELAIKSFTYQNIDGGTWTNQYFHLSGSTFECKCVHFDFIPWHNGVPDQINIAAIDVQVTFTVVSC